MKNFLRIKNMSYPFIRGHKSIFFTLISLLIAICWHYPLQKDVSASSVSDIKRSEVSGVELEVGNVEFQNNILSVEICFELPSKADWILINPLLEVNGAEVLYTSAELLNEDDFVAGKTKRRCDLVSYEVPAGTDLAQYKIIVPTLETTIPEAPDCVKAQKKLDDEKSGISLKCSPKEGTSGVIITKKPFSMTDEDLYKKVKGAFSESINGPWVFEEGIKK